MLPANAWKLIHNNLFKKLEQLRSYFLIQYQNNKMMKSFPTNRTNPNEFEWNRTISDEFGCFGRISDDSGRIRMILDYSGWIRNGK